ncbi:MAG: ABC transporter permease [Pirellulales bacterium]
MQIAFSVDLGSPRSEQLWIGYAGFKLTDPLPFSRSQANSYVETFALGVIIKLGLSIVCVFVGIIVTSAMIPETFKTGSLHLLLSKPISRPLLYLSKFLGGTIFMLANISYFLIGLYLVVGTRLGIWNAGLIYCIPLLLFVFVIFYSVSALVGLMWNNAIISVVACIGFWFFCTTIGLIRNGLRPSAEMVPQIVRVQEVGDETLAITQAGMVNVWNKEFSVWQPAVDLERRPSGRVLGPLVDPSGKRLLLRSDFRDPFGGFNTRSRNFVVVDLTDEIDQPARRADKPASDVQTETKKEENAETKTTDESSKQAKPADSKSSTADEIKTVDEARRKALWMGESGPEPPMLMIDLSGFGDQALATTRNGFFLIDWKTIDVVQSIKGGGVFDFLKTAANRAQSFTEITPVDYVFGSAPSVTVDGSTRRILAYNGATLDLLQLEDGAKKLKSVQSFKLDGDDKVPGLAAIGKSHFALAREGQGVIVLDAELTKVLHTLKLPDESDARQISAIPGTSQFSVVTHLGSWYRIDAESGTLETFPSRYQRSISAASWTDGDRVWLGVKPDRALLWNVKTQTEERTLTPQMSRLDYFYRWIADPLYKYNPKPAALDDAMSYLLNGKKEDLTQLVRTDLEATTLEKDIWQPIISNLAFVGLMLTIGCIWIVRKQY